MTRFSTVQDPPLTEAPVEPECRKDSDCPSKEACINEICENPCLLSNPCEGNQECHVIDRVVSKVMVCKCPEDMILVKDGVCMRLGQFPY